MGNERRPGGCGLTAEERKLLAALRTPRLREALLAIRQNSAGAQAFRPCRGPEREATGPR